MFASALAMLLRLQGVPARFASGFSGGEREPDGWLRVTARHGHAWVEAWNGERWATLEAVPSGSNAPDLARTEPQARRESSAPGGGAGATGSTPGPVAGAAVPAPEGPPSTAAAGRRARTPPANRSEAWLGALRERASGKAVRSARAHWPWALVLAALVAAGLAAGMGRLRLWSGWLLRLFNRRPDGLFDSRQERDFLNKLAAAGFVKEPWETLHEFLERLRQEGAAPESLAPLVDLSVRVRYSAVPPRPADIDLARHLLAALDREIRPTRKTGDTRPILKK
ncbi:MAG: transglutaminase domain-containing protein [Candidatus Wallbacteria bacterium]|nr:transglutaminase domain-containing protein [Candidatus Wallbacteria bacterium]